MAQRVERWERLLQVLLFACIFLLFILVAFKGTIKRQLRNDRSRHVESYIRFSLYYL